MIFIATDVSRALSCCWLQHILTNTKGFYFTSLNLHKEPGVGVEGHQDRAHFTDRKLRFREVT